MNRTKRYVAIGLLIDLIAPAFSVLLVTAWAALRYKGTCIDLIPLDAPSQVPCAFPEYLRQALVLILVFGEMAVRENWLIAVAALLLPPGVGYWLGRRRAVRA